LLHTWRFANASITKSAHCDPTTGTPSFFDDGQRREDVADLFKVSRVTLYRALA
jgi:hypothetical protein